jgi:hypothetical protein
VDSRRFIAIIHETIVPFLLDLGFSLSKTETSGRLYDVVFTASKHAVSISYEPGDNWLLVIVHTIRNGEMSRIDDRKNTPRLADLNARYMQWVTPEQLRAAKTAIDTIPFDEAERRLLKSALELRLVLPRYLEEQGGA